ncbi:M20/M25/M40 family metallo-hydrolase [Nocardia sp. NPDC052566]|uniref:M20/M25/M40 family metallo-hydrolase n=1 Tax=Nocardia sp. NPDC052566 TaxID=3364330 RepID=UPI0037C62CA8
MGSRLSGLLAFAILLAVVVATAWTQQPHGHRPESAPADVFSAGRAMRVIEEIAQRPHPLGTAEHDRVRDHLVAELRKLGLETEIQEGVGHYPSTLVREVEGMGRIANIVAELPGTNSTGTVYLTAHYDSVASGPGANDDGAGVATTLETVRALRAAGTGLRNDIVVLLTDGEEVGLLGAEAFVAAGKRSGVVINHEARGAGGPALLWRTTRPDGALIDTVATAPHPNTDSLTTALAGGQTSSNTDFASFEPGGLQVLDWAYAGKSAYYHNRFDDPAHVDRATLQQLGDNSLALAREFGGKDLADLADGGDRAYFQLPFGILVVLPLWVIIALAVATVLGAAWVVRQARRGGETSIARVLGATATAFVAVPIAMGAVYGLWEALKAIRPEYRPLFVDPYRPELYYLAIIVLSAAVVGAWFAVARKVFSASAAAAGMLCCVAVLGAAAAALAPAAAQALVVPAFFATVGVLATFVVPERWQLPVLTVFLVPAAISLGGYWSAAQTGITSTPFLVAPAVVLLGGLLLLTLAKAWPARRGWAIPLTTLTLAAALAAAGLVVDRFDDEHPMSSQLIYALDADRNEAQWLSKVQPDRWTDGFVGATAPEAQFATLWPTAVASGPASAQSLPRPTAEILSDTTESGQRTVRLRLHTLRGATILGLRYDTAPRTLRVAGRDLNPVPTKGFSFSAPPAEGIEVEITAPAGPLALHVLDSTWLPDSGLDIYRNPPPDIYFRQDSLATVFATIPGL